MSSDIAVSVRGLSKSYTISHDKEKSDTLIGAMLGRLKDPLRRPNRETFWALKDVSFDIKKGDVVGVIGRNGAGKSTLLKILSRITEPTTGEIHVFGRIGSLLEVGTGFHPELTGRENVFLNGAILGMAKAEIRKQFDAIVDFAGVEKFLDTPVKRYSSGMYVRLAFAVAAHLNPEILIVDEVLAVGDAEFQKKCIGKMKDVAGAGRTVLFVSHQTNAVQSLCNRVIYLAKGSLLEDGATREVLSKYLSADRAESEWVISENNSAYRNPYFSPKRFCVVDDALKPLTRSITASAPPLVLIEGEIEQLESAMCVGFVVYASSGENMFISLATDQPTADWPKFRPGFNRLIARLPEHFLNEGEYRLELAVSLHFVQWFSEPGKNAPAVSFSVKGGLSDSPFWMAARPGLNAPVLNFKLLEPA